MFHKETGRAEWMDTIPVMGGGWFRNRLAPAANAIFLPVHTALAENSAVSGAEQCGHLRQFFRKLAESESGQDRTQWPRSVVYVCIHATNRPLPRFLNIVRWHLHFDGVSSYFLV